MKKLFFVFLLCIIQLGIAQTGSGFQADELPTVTVHAEDTHLATVLAILAQESGYNIVTGPNVNAQDRLTIHLDEVAIDQAINLVVRAAGLSYEIIGTSILVAVPSKLREEVGISSQVISLQYANASEVKDLLTNITENIQVDQTGNKLLISTSPKKFSEIEGIIAEIDEPALQIMLEARLSEVTLKDEEVFGIDWSKLSQIELIMAESGAPNLVGGTTSGSLVPGVTFTTNTVTGEVEEAFSPLKFQQMPEQMYFQRLDPGEPIRFSRQLTAFDVTLDFLLKENRAELLANSQVVALNGKEAIIEMVDVVPYILSAGGVGGQVQVQREEVGIKLKIVPIVNSDGYITTQVTPEVSSIFDFIGPDNNIPWVKRRQSNTTIRVKENQSIIIAGLLGSDKKYEEHRLPLFWRIPYVGEKLFTHTREIESKTDLIIQITPKIVRDDYTGIDKKEYHIEAENAVYNRKVLESELSPESVIPEPEVEIEQEDIEEVDQVEPTDEPVEEVPTPGETQLPDEGADEPTDEDQ